MAKYYTYESGTQAIVIDLNSIYAIRRDGNQYLLHTTGGAINITEAAWQKILPVWKTAVVGTATVRG